MIRKLLLLSVLLSVLLLVNCQEDDFLQEQNKESETTKWRPSAHEQFSREVYITQTKQEAFEIARRMLNDRHIGLTTPGLGGFGIWPLSIIIYNNTDKDLILKRKREWKDSYFLTGVPKKIPPKKYAAIVSANEFCRQGVHNELVYQYDNVTTCFGSSLPFWFFGFYGSSNVLVNFSEFNNNELDYHSRATMTKRLGNLEISGKITPLSYGPHYAEFSVSTLSNLKNPLNSQDFVSNNYKKALKMINDLKAAYGTGLTAKIIIYNKTNKNLIFKNKNTWYGSGFFSEPPRVIPAHGFGVVLAKHQSQCATGVYNALTYRYKNREVSFGTYVPWAWVYTNNIFVDYKEINYDRLYHNSTRPWLDRRQNGLRLTGHTQRGDSPLIHFTVEKY